MSSSLAGRLTRSRPSGNPRSIRAEVRRLTVQEAIAAAEQILPGRAVPEDTKDSRWQAVIEIGNFVAEEPEAIWPFVLKWFTRVKVAANQPVTVDEMNASTR